MHQTTDSQHALNLIEQLRSLYLSGYRSEVIDRSVAKLLGIERFAIERQLAELQTRLSAYESQYGMPSSDFYARFKAGTLGDAMDYFEWAAFCELRDSALRQLALLANVPAQ
jgi:hypothetical protein